ncbi:MAG: transmembrane 220 family protein [Bacteroidota bacterium]
MKVFNIIFCILFIVSAALQYNDPDPYLWMPIYLYGAVICAMAYKSQYFPKWCIIGITAFSLYAIFLVFKHDGVVDWVTKHNADSITATMKAATPWVEIAREFFGLVIVIIVLLINYLYSGRCTVAAKN